MKTIDYKIHENGSHPLAEIDTNGVRINNAQEFLEIMMNAPAERIAVHQKNLAEAFFELKSGLAGEILQKVVNYRRRLAIVGEFGMYTSKNLRDFIYESNNTNVIVFTATIEEAIQKLAK